MRVKWWYEPTHYKGGGSLPGNCINHPNLHICKTLTRRYDFWLCMTWLTLAALLLSRPVHWKLQWTHGAVDSMSVGKCVDVWMNACIANCACTSACVRVYVCACVYVCECVYVSMCVCESVYMYVCVCIYVCVCMCVCLYVCAYACMSVYVCVCMWWCVCVFIRV